MITREPLTRETAIDYLRSRDFEQETRTSGVYRLRKVRVAFATDGQSLASINTGAEWSVTFAGDIIPWTAFTTMVDYAVEYTEQES